MASRKTDFNTEDIMGSLLGMNRQEKENREETPKEKEVIKKDQEQESEVNVQTEEIPRSIKKENVPYYVDNESEYIPIENIRIRRRDEKEMKVPVSFSLSRKTAEQLKQIAYVERLSSSEIVSGLIEAYIHAHKDVLEEYHDLVNRRKM